MQNIQSLPNPFFIIPPSEKAEKRNILSQRVALTVLGLGILTTVAAGVKTAATFSAPSMMAIHIVITGQIVITGLALITSIVAYKTFIFIRDINKSLDYAPFGWGPLHLSAAKGQVIMTRLLLFLGAEPNQTRNGDTPLHMACFKANKPKSKAHIKVMDILVKAGAHINANGNVGRCPLHYALEARHADRVEFLVEHGAYINLKQSCDPDWSPWEYAVRAHEQQRISGKQCSDPRSDQELLEAEKLIYQTLEEKGKVYSEGKL